MVCYGIGQVGICRTAQHQFGLLAELMISYQPQILIYDPVLQEQEKMAITECGCQIMPRNEVSAFAYLDALSQ